VKFNKDYKTLFIEREDLIYIYIMFGGGRYFGLRGKRLNYAIGLIAGVDFL